MSGLILGLSLVGGLAQVHAESAPLAFPGAEGFGRHAQGGRGGRVFIVDKLEDDGPGSLREAVQAEGPRTVVFAVSGTIELASALAVQSGYLTIAGQTAPGDGITLKNHALVIEADHVIVRHIRSRPGDDAGIETDAVWVRRGDHVIIDHVSTSWGNDETLTVSPAPDRGDSPIGNVTVQWSIIAESLNESVHSKGAHGYGSLVRGGAGSRYSFHHNLWAHHRARMPRPGNYLGRDRDPVGPLMDFSNNVFYNWGNGHSGYNQDQDSVSRYNFVNNYYLQGPDSGRALAFREYCPFAVPYFAGNMMDHELPSDPWALVRFEDGRTRPAGRPHPNGGVRVEAPADAYQAVLRSAGASLHRDAVDARIVDSVRRGTGGIIDSTAEVGGWPLLASGPAPADADRDGMPDDWERAHGLQPLDPTDGPGDANGDGYTNLEEYLSALTVGRR